ncbi:MAG: SDR family NAD(P)-dependent oxidoreductase [Hamadaea sp.]|uniref:SDR family NAD(P)-dependent oxidoreductase n=1 Tax=Hamadaea sp. TaxID=2024425 RepID=UPI0017F78478|nr:SDR family NAD(P)-dependent oxidoreductase [Hamadaea sp.]NUR69912.1 SDR family NAD(P)-dependent oxidoreductase [Hamadaea sp.]NUT22516.1 SDR family NAD(P)-dependent oxidoreductase [Hamadaea sp.]
MERATHWLKVIGGIVVPGIGDGALRRRVAGRVVLVTGASEGIGAATAVRLGAAGATVLLAARTESRLREVQATIEGAGGQAYVYPADLSDPEQAERLGEQILREHRRVDTVVCNAGRSIRRSVADTADRFHDVVRTTDLNYLGPVRLLLTLLPAMRANGGGHIVNVSTAGVLSPAQNWSSYLASKAAFDMWLRCAAPELRLDGVTVSSFYSGLVRTRMSAPTKFFRRYPAADPEEAASTVCRAVARRPRTLQPWWSRPGEVLATAGKGPVERGMAAGARLLPFVAVSSMDPLRLIRLAWASRRYGWTLAAATAGGRTGDVALIDRTGPLTRGELQAAAESCASALRDRGVQPGDRIGIRCATHRGLAITATAAGLLGLDTVLLPPHAEPADTLTVLIGDDARGTSWTTLISEPGTPLRGRPPIRGRLTVLTSGTTGTPRPVRRKLTWRALLGPALAHLKHIPIRTGRPIIVAVPAYHGYGLSYLAAGLALGAPVVLVPGKDPAAVLAAAKEHRPTAVFALPEHLAGLAAHPDAAELPRGVRIVTGAEPLDPQLSQRLLEVFGDRVYNLFGSTEAGWAAMATPADLKAAPGTVGRAPAGVRLHVLTDDGRPALPGETGVVHVGGWLPRGRLVATGDLGHLDRAGRLMLDGRVRS